MANDCLVTKMRGIVNNSSLSKIGELFLEYHIPDNQISSIYIGDNFYMKNVGKLKVVEGNNYFTNSSASENFGSIANLPVDSGAIGLYLSQGTCKASLTSKYNVRYLNNDYVSPSRYISLDLGSICYMTSLSKLKLNSRCQNKGTLDLDAIHSEEAFTELTVSGVSCKGDLSSLDLSIIEKISIGSSDIIGLDTTTGDMLSIANPNLSFMYICSYTNITACSAEQFVNKIRTAGKSTGEINLNWIGGAATISGFTIGGEEISSLSYQGSTYSGSAKLVWTASTISIVDPSTSNVIKTVNA